ncbi:protein LIAT1 [Cololabis saira]|uniref:protein LIAT1 n=1 Tax=Cololabis saira TaxID=129043 RepID=UPI002AD20A8D|nr:protein LIAT1 [Cololabis saira]
MSENKNWKLLQGSRITDDGKKKKKKKKKASTSTPVPRNKEKPMAVSLCPETSPVSKLPPLDPRRTPGQLPKLKATGKKNGKQSTGSVQKSKKYSRDSQSLLPVTRKTSSSKDPAHVTELQIQARESLRWEGVLQDPQEEAERLEQYRANRRQRYIAHREALLK